MPASCTVSPAAPSTHSAHRPGSPASPRRLPHRGLRRRCALRACPACAPGIADRTAYLEWEPSRGRQESKPVRGICSTKPLSCFFLWSSGRCTLHWLLPPSMDPVSTMWRKSGDHGSSLGGLSIPPRLWRSNCGQSRPTPHPPRPMPCSRSRRCLSHPHPHTLPSFGAVWAGHRDGMHLCVAPAPHPASSHSGEGGTAASFPSSLGNLRYFARPHFFVSQQWSM